jgi:hypothetical protein
MQWIYKLYVTIRCNYWSRSHKPKLNYPNIHISFCSRQLHVYSCGHLEEHLKKQQFFEEPFLIIRFVNRSRSNVFSFIHLIRCHMKKTQKS